MINGNFPDFQKKNVVKAFFFVLNAKNLLIMLVLL